MALRDPVYPACLGLALEQRYAGKPNGNKTLDGVRNRRYGLKGGRKVLAKPRPRGFYYGIDGRVSLQISNPTGLQTSNIMIQTEKKSAGVDFAPTMLTPPRDGYTRPTTNALTPIVKVTSAIEDGPAASVVANSVPLPRIIRPRDSIEIMYARGRVVKRTPPPKNRSAVRLMLNSGTGELTIVTPRGYEFPAAVIEPSQSAPVAKRGGKRASGLWNGFFSPDGTVRTSIILQNAPALPRSAYTDSDLGFVDENLLPKTIYLGPNAYHCRESEYFLPAITGQVHCRQSGGEVPLSQLNPDYSIASNTASNLPTSYDPALGYLSLDTALHSAEDSEANRSRDTLHSMDVTIGVNCSDLDTSYEAYRPPEQHLSPASAPPTYQAYRPSPPATGATSPQMHARHTAPRSHVRTSWIASYYAENGFEVGKATAVPVRMATPVRVRDGSPASPVGEAVLNRARANFQRASSVGGHGGKSARPHVRAAGIL